MAAEIQLLNPILPGDLRFCKFLPKHQYLVVRVNGSSIGLEDFVIVRKDARPAPNIFGRVPKIAQIIRLYNSDSEGPSAMVSWYLQGSRIPPEIQPDSRYPPICNHYDIILDRTVAHPSIKLSQIQSPTLAKIFGPTAGPASVTLNSNLFYIARFGLKMRKNVPRLVPLCSRNESEERETRAQNDTGPEEPKNVVGKDESLRCASVVPASSYSPIPGSTERVIVCPTPVKPSIANPVKPAVSAGKATRRTRSRDCSDDVQDEAAVTDDGPSSSNQGTKSSDKIISSKRRKIAVPESQFQKERMESQANAKPAAKTSYKLRQVGSLHADKAAPTASAFAPVTKSPDESEAGPSQQRQNPPRWGQRPTQRIMEDTPREDDTPVEPVFAKRVLRRSKLTTAKLVEEQVECSPFLDELASPATSKKTVNVKKITDYMLRNKETEKIDDQNSELEIEDDPGLDLRLPTRSQTQSQRATKRRSFEKSLERIIRDAPYESDDDVFDFDVAAASKTRASSRTSRSDTASSSKQPSDRHTRTSSPEKQSPRKQSIKLVMEKNVVSSPSSSPMSSPVRNGTQVDADLSSGDSSPPKSKRTTQFQPVPQDSITFLDEQPTTKSTPAKKSIFLQSTKTLEKPTVVTRKTDFLPDSSDEDELREPVPGTSSATVKSLQVAITRMSRSQIAKMQPSSANEKSAKVVQPSNPGPSSSTREEEEDEDSATDSENPLPKELRQALRVNKPSSSQGSPQKTQMSANELLEILDKSPVPGCSKDLSSEEPAGILHKVHVNASMFESAANKARDVLASTPEPVFDFLSADTTNDATVEKLPEPCLEDVIHITSPDEPPQTLHESVVTACSGFGTISDIGASSLRPRLSSSGSGLSSPGLLGRHADTSVRATVDNEERSHAVVSPTWVFGSRTGSHPSPSSPPQRQTLAQTPAQNPVQNSVQRRISTTPAQSYESLYNSYMTPGNSMSRRTSASNATVSNASGSGTSSSSATYHTALSSVGSQDSFQEYEALPMRLVPPIRICLPPAAPTARTGPSSSSPSARTGPSPLSLSTTPGRAFNATQLDTQVDVDNVFTRNQSKTSPLKSPKKISNLLSLASAVEKRSVKSTKEPKASTSTSSEGKPNGASSLGDEDMSQLDTQVDLDDLFAPSSPRRKSPLKVQPGDKDKKSPAKDAAVDAASTSDKSPPHPGSPAKRRINFDSSASSLSRRESPRKKSQAVQSDSSPKSSPSKMTHIKLSTTESNEIHVEAIFEPGTSTRKSPRKLSHILNPAGLSSPPPTSGDNASPGAERKQLTPRKTPQKKTSLFSADHEDETPRGKSPVKSANDSPGSPAVVLDTPADAELIFAPHTITTRKSPRKLAQGSRTEALALGHSKCDSPLDVEDTQADMDDIFAPSISANKSPKKLAQKVGEQKNKQLSSDSDDIFNVGRKPSKELTNGENQSKKMEEAAATKKHTDQESSPLPECRVVLKDIHPRTSGDKLALVPYQVPTAPLSPAKAMPSDEAGGPTSATGKASNTTKKTLGISRSRAVITDDVAPSTRRSPRKMSPSKSESKNSSDHGSQSDVTLEDSSHGTGQSSQDKSAQLSRSDLSNDLGTQLDTQEFVSDTSGIFSASSNESVLRKSPRRHQAAPNPLKVSLAAMRTKVAIRMSFEGDQLLSLRALQQRGSSPSVTSEPSTSKRDEKPSTPKSSPSIANSREKRVHKGPPPNYKEKHSPVSLGSGVEIFRACLRKKLDRLEKQGALKTPKMTMKGGGKASQKQVGALLSDTSETEETEEREEQEKVQTPKTTLRGKKASQKRVSALLSDTSEKEEQEEQPVKTPKTTLRGKKASQKPVSALLSDTSETEENSMDEQEDVQPAKGGRKKNSSTGKIAENNSTPEKTSQTRGRSPTKPSGTPTRGSRQKRMASVSPARNVAKRGCTSNTTSLTRSASKPSTSLGGHRGRSVGTPRNSGRNKRIMQGGTAAMNEANAQELPGREQQMADIKAFIMRKLVEKSGGCMYLSGVPGTGKTASVTQVVLELNELVQEGELPKFKLVSVSGMELTQPQLVFSRMAEELLGVKCAASVAQDKLASYFGNNDAKRPPTLLIIDELDMLCTRRQDVVYSLFDWPSKTNARLTVLAIANTMDLPERLLKGRVASRLGLTRLVFTPYSYSQLTKIINVKLESAADFAQDALEYVARKVASVSGDVRRALDICRRAAEVAGPGRPVRMDHVLKTLNEMLNSHLKKAVGSCSKLGRHFLRCLLSEMRRTGLETSIFEAVYTAMLETATFFNVPAFSVSQVSQTVAQLSVMGILLVSEGFVLQQQLRLNVNSDELMYALEDVGE